MDHSLLLQKNSRIYLLVKYADRYHIITVNSNLDEDKEERILAGICSDAEIDEMGLTHETIMKSDLRGVAIGGCCAGDVIVLHTKDRKRKYVLSDDYCDEDIHGLFTGIERFQPPKNSSSKSPKADWRTQAQTESMRKIMGIIGIVLNTAGCLCLLCASLFGRLSAMWSIICLSVTVISMGLYFAYPQYFLSCAAKHISTLGIRQR